MTTRFTKILTGIAAAATLAVSAIALSSPAQAHWHGGWGHGWHGWGGPFVIGGYYGPNCDLVNVYSKSGRYLRTVQRCY
jgi:hypothetical protein